MFQKSQWLLLALSFCAISLQAHSDFQLNFLVDEFIAGPPCSVHWIGQELENIAVDDLPEMCDSFSVTRDPGTGQITAIQCQEYGWAVFIDQSKEQFFGEDELAAYEFAIELHSRGQCVYPYELIIED
jgi:hypothetical protein